MDEVKRKFVLKALDIFETLENKSPKGFKVNHEELRQFRSKYVIKNVISSVSLRELGDYEYISEFLEQPSQISRVENIARTGKYYWILDNIDLEKCEMSDFLCNETCHCKENELEKSLISGNQPAVFAW